MYTIARAHSLKRVQSLLLLVEDSASQRADVTPSKYVCDVRVHVNPVIPELQRSNNAAGAQMKSSQVQRHDQVGAHRRVGNLKQARPMQPFYVQPVAGRGRGVVAGRQVGGLVLEVADLIARVQSRHLPVAHISQELR